MDKIRLLALDLDGTLLTNSKQLTARSRLALVRAAEAGILVVPVTGRPLSGIPEEIMEIPSVRFVISSNGAVTTDRRTGAPVRTAFLDRDAAASIAAIPAARGLIHSVFIGGFGYCERDFFDMQWAYYRDRPIASYVKKSRRVTDDLQALIRQEESGVENIWINAGSREIRDEVDSLVRMNWQVQTTLTAVTDVEIGSPEADKGKALTALAQQLQIPRGQVMAFGDNDNDLGMLREAGIAVAVGNAPESVRKEADLVTATNEEDGVAKVIEEMLAPV